MSSHTPTSQQQNLTPAADNHPLAGPPPPPPPPPPGQHASKPSSQSVEVSLPRVGTAPSSQQAPTPSQQQQLQPPPLSSPTAVVPPSNPFTAPTAPQPLPHASPLPSAASYTSPGKNIATASDASNAAAAGGASSVQSLDDLVDLFLSGPSYRTEQMLPPLLRPPPLETDNLLQCLKTLVERRAWGDVLQVTADLLRGTDSAYAPIYDSILSSESTSTPSRPSLEDVSAQLKDEAVEIIALQCHAWLKLRRYSDLGQEIERWNFVSFNDNYDPDKAATWVPWSLHILAAETLLHTTDDPHRGTDELHALVSRIPESNDTIRWKCCTCRALANAFSRKREWRMAMVSLERILPLIEEATRQELIMSNASSPVHQVLVTAYRTELFSVQGRYLLHAGAVAEAGHLFQESQNEWNRAVAEVGSAVMSCEELKNHVVVQHTPAQLLANEGLLSFAYTNYDQAIESFKNSTDSLREYSLDSAYRPAEWVGPTVVGVAAHANLFNECINNMAICALYTCRMPEAVSLMESLVREDPTAFLTERVAFNLCTMYELGCDSTASARKKRVLQLVAKRFFLHDVGPESFRIA